MKNTNLHLTYAPNDILSKNVAYREDRDKNPC